LQVQLFSFIKRKVQVLIKSLNHVHARGDINSRYMRQQGHTSSFPSMRMVVFSYSHTCTVVRCRKRM
jgi:hypothetical protein